ncbi:MAG: NifB/NifX family molybdenum-iron cluster-binding protein [Bacillota bacterium]
MKIAVASEKNLVTEHFGHCQNFNIFEVENNKIATKTSIDNPGHRPGFLPKYLASLGVNVVISGGMGGGAIDLFREHNIQTITGASGDAEKVVKDFLSGELKSDNNICHEHKHYGEC